MNSAKLQGKKINIQNLVVLLHANNELFEIEIEKTIIFIIATK
jgi:hypothetical protein